MAFYKNHKNPGVNANTYLNNHDLISKFRFFENGPAQADSEKAVEQYLDLYHSGPLTKAELLNRFAEGKSVDENFAKNFKIRRAGKDKDDIFWNFGKIHGLENIVLCDLEEVKKVVGDPIALQKLVNKAMDERVPWVPSSYDEAVTDAHQKLEAFKAAVEGLETNGMNLKSSDKKKLLALPFYLSKRQELPDPKYGQKEYELFKEMYGLDYNYFQNLVYDSEEKITEFNYENFISKHILKTLDTQSDKFKTIVKKLNFYSKTQYE